MTPKYSPPRHSLRQISEMLVPSSSHTPNKWLTSSRNTDNEKSLMRRSIENASHDCYAWLPHQPGVYNADLRIVLSQNCRYRAETGRRGYNIPPGKPVHGAHTYHHHHHLIFTRQAKQQYQNRLYIDTMCEWVKRPRIIIIINN